MAIPPFWAGPATRWVKEDFVGSENGARKLCALIERRWSECGHPEIRAEPRAVVTGRKDHPAIWGIHISGLHNGLPLVRYKERAA